MTNTYNHYNIKLKPFARKLRSKSTNAEIIIWNTLLKNKKMKGYPFLRQRPIDKYIADFLSKELKLIIEVDGGSHIMKGEADKQRDERLLALGFTTLRFTNDEVMYRTDDVRLMIENWIMGRKRRR